MKRRPYIIGVSILGLVLIGTGIWYVALPHVKQAVVTIPKLSVTPTPTTPFPPTSSIAIVALKAHATRGGTISTVRQLAARGGCPTSIVSYPSDGLTVTALLEVPTTSKPAGGYPVIIVAHGYYPPAAWTTDTTNAYSDQDYMNAFCVASYISIRPDYRGNGGSQGTANGGDIYPDYTYDVLNLIHSLSTLTGANASSVGIEGHSMGGAIALKTIVTDPQVKASSFVAGVTTSLQNIVYDWAPDPISSDIQAQVRAAVSLLGGTPTQNPTAWHDASALNYASQITGPVQINAGTADETVPYQWSKDFDAALTAVNVDHTFISYPGTDHIFTRSSDRANLIANMVSFFTTNISTK